MSYNREVCGFLILFLLSFVADSARAISIDEFEGAQTTITSSATSPQFSSVSHPTVAGGFRSIEAQASGSGTLIVEVGAGIFEHNQTLNLTGTSIVHWDGNADSTSIDPTGLGGLDLLQDGADAFQLVGVDSDLVPFSITVTVYDANDATGNTFSTYTLNVDKDAGGNPPVFPLTYELPFAAFSAGPSGAADFTNVGAIVMTVTGAGTRIDLGLDAIRTNGKCPIPPDKNGKVIDECGVCGGDNSSCSDCVGVPNGPNTPGTTCDTGLPGVCSKGTYNASCFCDSDQDPSPERCDGEDNDCDGLVDESFPLLGKECGSGEGKCRIEGIYICDADGGLRCDADIDFDYQFQECGDTIGCDGVPNSNLNEDECGICGGDGSLCDGCGSRDISELLFLLDGGAKKQEAAIQQYSRRLLRITRGNTRIRNFVDRLLVRAHDLQIRNWILSWTLPRISVTCPDVLPNCVQVSNTPILDEYRTHSEELRQLHVRVLRKLRRNGKSKRYIVRGRKRAAKLHQSNLDLAAQVPDLQSRCH